MINLLSSLPTSPLVLLPPNVGSTVFTLSYNNIRGLLAVGTEDGNVAVYDEGRNFECVGVRKCGVSAGLKINHPNGGEGEFEVLRVRWGEDSGLLYAGTASGVVEVLSAEGGRVTVKGVLDCTEDEDGNVLEVRDELAPQVYGLCEVGKGRVAVGTDDEVNVWNVGTASRHFQLRFRRVGGRMTGGGRNPRDLVYVFGMDWCEETEEVSETTEGVRMGAGHSRLLTFCPPHLPPPPLQPRLPLH